MRAELKHYIAIATSLGAELVAEGVEDAPDLAVLRDLGIEYAQGLLLGPPGLARRGHLGASPVSSLIPKVYLSPFAPARRTKTKL